MFRYRMFVLLALVLLLAAGVAAQDLTIDGRVVDSENQPVVGAQVNLRPLLGPFERSLRLMEEGVPWGESVDRTVTDGQGRYRLGSPDWGLYKVVVEARGMCRPSIECDRCSTTELCPR